MTKRILIALLAAIGLLFAGAPAAAAQPDRSWCVMDGLTVVKDDMTQEQAERMAARTGLSAERGLICDYQPAALVADGAAVTTGVKVEVRRPALASFVIESNDPLVTRESDVAALWSKAGVNASTGACAGAGCVTVVVVAAPCGGPYLGCAYGWDYAQGCTVEISRSALEWGRNYGLPDYAFNILGHEVGHCVIGSAWHDTSAERSIMYPTLHYGDRARGLTKPVKDAVAARFPRP